jgi:AbrB family looped-hinge helix DNA binding protein
MATTKMTRKGQVTIPADIRHKLGIHEGDRFVVREVNGDVILRSERSIVKRTAGVFRDYAIQPSLSKEEMHEAFVEGMVEDYLESRDEQ